MRRASFLPLQNSLGFGRVALLALLPVAVWACSGSDSPACEGANCQGTTTGPQETADGGATPGPGGSTPVGTVPAPEGCDPNAEPREAPKCVVNEYGIFVDAAGADTNPGTREAPVKTFAVALTKLAGRARIYVCDGTYPEHVTLTSPVAIYGGFACGAWTYAVVKPKLAPIDPGSALHIASVAGPVFISDLEIAAGPTLVAGASSIGIFASESGRVTLRRTAVYASDGKAGADGVALANYDPLRALQGTNFVDPLVVPEKPNSLCPSSVGGAGGAKGGDGGPGKVSRAVPYPSASYTGLGGDSGTGGSDTGDDGEPGSYGDGGSGGAGAATIGSLDATGWSPTSGTAGAAGGNGQGGGGGGNEGGGGGVGGCGGAGGPRGTGGGASVAIVAYQTPIVLEQTLLTARAAGRGGNGGNGQLAQGGGLKSTRAGRNGGVGGPGGHGGSGGGGGAGSGGISAGIAYKGIAPTIEGAELVAASNFAGVAFGAPGAKGLKGRGAAGYDASGLPGTDGGDGVDGLAAAVLAIP